jgi:chromosome segregation ATPase
MTNENNSSNNMDGLVKIDDFNTYSKHIAEQLNSIKTDLNTIKSIKEEAGVNPLLEEYIEKLRNRMNEMFSYLTYVGENMNGVIDNVNGLKEHNNHIVENVKTLKGYVDHVAEQSDYGIQYIEDVAKKTNDILEYNNYLSEHVDNIAQYGDHLSEGMNQLADYTEYLKENIEVLSLQYFLQIQWLINQNAYLDVLKHPTWILFNTENVRLNTDRNYWPLNLRPAHGFDDSTWRNIA